MTSYKTPKKMNDQVVNSVPNAPYISRIRHVGGYVKVLSPSPGGVVFMRDLLPEMKVEECDPRTLFSESVPWYIKLVKVSTIDYPRFLGVQTSWEEIVYVLTNVYKFSMIERSTPDRYGTYFCNYDPAEDKFEEMFESIDEDSEYNPIFADHPPGLN